jgi:hypothetical protein
VEFTEAQKAEARKIAIWQLWNLGDLRFKLHATQRRIYDAIAQSPAKRHFLCCSRRLGKSFLLVCLAFERALKKPGTRVLFLAPWSKDAADIATDAAAKIMADAPPELRPEYKAQNKELTFKNGSLIRFRGTNGEHAQFLRGSEAELVILDECGLMDDLKHVVNDIVEPMTLTVNGSVILATTPARTPGHESKIFCDEAFRQGCGHEFTLLDAPHLSEEQRARALAAAGEAPEDVPSILAGTVLPKTTTGQREYFCKWVTDAATAVIPEFDDKAKAEIVKNHNRPPYFDAYVSIDPGFVDKTGILFGYWDSRYAKLVIEDEWVKDHVGTKTIADAIKNKEEDLWGRKFKPFLRVSDTDARLISDLINDHGLWFTPSPKADSKAAIWNLRQMVANRSLVILPKCVNLIRQMQNAVWNRKATDFERDSSEDKIDGHYDLLAALKYLARVVNKERNPYPDWWAESYPTERDARRARRLPRDGTLRIDTPITRKLNKAGI